MFTNHSIKPRMRVIIDNDFGGDPDGLVQLTHHILSPSVEIRGIIGSRFMSKGFFGAHESAERACESARELLAVMDAAGKFPIFRGADSCLHDIHTPEISEGAQTIVREAMRNDTSLPLYVACGAGLTNIASAFLMEPKISERLTLIWIGGPEYSDLALPPPGSSSLEYNMAIDIKAAQVIFNTSNIPLWQVPRDAYRQVLLSYAELQLKIKPNGNIGKYLAEKIEDVMRTAQNHELSLGETYVMGDSPLVLLTALQSAFDSDPSSSGYLVKPAPKINDAGLYDENPSARAIRVYTNLDTRLLFDDFFSKLSLLSSE
jgi:purine nucleosidase